MGFQQFAQRKAHGFFNVARLHDVARDTKQLGAGIVGPADGGEPGGTPAQDVGRRRDRLHIIDRGRTAVEPDIGGERRLKPRLALLALEAFEQRGFLAADISAGAVMQIEIEIPAVHVALADQLGVVGLVDRRLQCFALADEFAADIDVAGIGAHAEAGDQATLDQEMRIVPHDLAVLAGAGLGFVGVDHEIMRPPVGFLGHERPFQSGRKSGAATAAQARRLHLVDDLVAAAFQNRLGAVPGAARTRAFETPIVKAVEILEDAVLVGEHSYSRVDFA